MQQQPQILFRDIDSSEALEADILKRAEKLNRISDDIHACRVTLGPEGKHKHQGTLYKVTVDLTVPGTQLIAANHPLNEDLYVAIRDAFDAAARQLEEYAQRRRHEVKSHA